MPKLVSSIDHLNRIGRVVFEKKLEKFDSFEGNYFFLKKIEKLMARPYIKVGFQQQVVSIELLIPDFAR